MTMTDNPNPRRQRECRRCGETLTIFHACPLLALKDQEESLAQATIETSSSTPEDEWAEIRERFPLTSARIIEALKGRSHEKEIQE